MRRLVRSSIEMESADAAAATTSGSVIVQFESGGQRVGPQIDVPLETTAAQLQQILDHFSSEAGKSSFRMNGVEVTTTIGDLLGSNPDIATELVVPIMYAAISEQPAANELMSEQMNEQTATDSAAAVATTPPAAVDITAITTVAATPTVAADRLQQAVREAIDQTQGDEAHVVEVQPHVLKTLGVELGEEELIPIAEKLLEEDAAAAAAAVRAARRQEILASSEPPVDEPSGVLIPLDITLRYVQARDNAQVVAVQFQRERECWDGSTRINAENAEIFDRRGEIPSLNDYRDKAKRAPDSLPARFYRMVTGEEWDGEALSYSLATKKFRRLCDCNDPDYLQKECERQQRRTKRDYSHKKRPADDNQRRKARRKAQREREKAALPVAA